MSKSEIFLGFFPYRVSIYPFRNFVIFFLILVFSLIISCAEKKMSLKEAKQVTVSMSDKPFVPPPRRVDDILRIIDRLRESDNRQITILMAKLTDPPPNTDNAWRLAKFYYDRGMRAKELGIYRQFLTDLRQAVTYAEKVQSPLLRNPADYFHMLIFCAVAEAGYGNFRRGIELVEQSFDKYDSPIKYYLLSWFSILTGDLNKGEEVAAEGIRNCNRKLAELGGRYQDTFIAWRNVLQAGVLYAKGRFIEAEPYRRSAVRILCKSLDGAIIRQKPCFYHTGLLCMNLAYQERLFEAEQIARETLTAAFANTGRASTLAGEYIALLGEILLRQGRLNDAEKLLTAGHRLIQDSGIPKYSLTLGYTEKTLGEVFFARQKFNEAVMSFDITKESMGENPYVYEKFIALNPNVMLALLKVGRIQEALKYIPTEYEKSLKYLGEKNYKTAELLAFRAIANASLGKEREAMNDFSAALSILANQKTGDHDYLKNLRRRIIIEAYLDLLTKIYEEQTERDFQIDAPAEIFNMCEALNRSIVKTTLGESGARSAAVDSDLADLVRREQDTLKQLNTLQRTLVNALAASPDQQNPEALKDLKTSIDTLRSANEAFFEEIHRRFPKYSEFTNPAPVSFPVIQGHLRPGEAMIAIYPASDRTYIWAVPAIGKIRFHISPLGEKELHEKAVHLRKSLAPSPETFADIPDFDLAQAYDLYLKLLMPVKVGWEDAKNLIVLAGGALGQLPLAILPTNSVDFNQKESLLFAKYRNVPWLIRKFSTTRVPSASSFVTLRKLKEGDPKRKAFVGFGDPLYNPGQLVRAENADSVQEFASSNEEGSLKVRGIRVSESGNLDNDKITSIHLGLLNRLPDTAKEIKSIAKTLGADPLTDIFLGKQASELRVKTMDLSNRRIVVFATHALVPGDLDGLDQPALALSAPSVTGDKEDGLLTMGEILKIKLNADWVVLSACNTGAANGRGAEAVSGLGQAFFYAGTRALLVSMWPVETTSARKLTTGLFRYQNEDKTLDRAGALRKAMLDLIDGPGLTDIATGKKVASYAHPLFWAPFILVGDTGRNTH